MADFAAQSLAIVGFGTLTEATNIFNLVTSAESLASGSGVTTYYLMIGWDTVVPTAETVWQVTSTPDLTGASSGNPTINAATIRILKVWSA